MLTSHPILVHKTKNEVLSDFSYVPIFGANSKSKLGAQFDPLHTVSGMMSMSGAGTKIRVRSIYR